MVELFQLIMNNPLQFLAGLGISSSAIYSCVRVIKGLVYLITKKHQNAKIAQSQNAMADAVISKLGGVENLIDKIANAVIDKITTSKIAEDMKTALSAIAGKNDCPAELKAYIQTVLSQSGSEELMLIYEQVKASIIASAKTDIQDAIEKGTTKIEQEKPAEVAPMPPANDAAVIKFEPDASPMQDEYV